MMMAEPVRLKYVRLAAEHVDRLMDIEVEAYPDPWTAGMFRDELRNPRSYFYVAHAGEEIAGYGGFWLVLDEAHITSVTIAEGYRGHGLGRQMTRFLLETAAKAGAHMATLEVRRSNTVAQHLYLTQGFRQVGVRKGYYPRSGEDAIVMLKELD